MKKKKNARAGIREFYRFVGLIWFLVRERQSFVFVLPQQIRLEEAGPPPHHRTPESVFVAPFQTAQFFHNPHLVLIIIILPAPLALTTCANLPILQLVGARLSDPPSPKNTTQSSASLGVSQLTVAGLGFTGFPCRMDPDSQC